MARLYPVLPIHPDETHRSWAARLAAFHIGAPVTVMFEDMNIDPFAYALGAPDEVARLAEITGVSLEDMNRATLTRVNSRSRRVAGTPARTNSPKRNRFKRTGDGDP